MNQNNIEKISKMIEELPRDKFFQSLFPSKNFHSIFIDLVKWKQNKITMIKSYDGGRKKFNITKNFIDRLKIERNFDPIYDKLYKDQYTVTKKIDAHKTSEDFINKMDSGETISPETLCDEYEKQYERTCKLYFKPFTKIISYKLIRECGNCIRKLRGFEPNLELLLQPFIPQIRNSINHSDFYPDKHKNVIIFEDEDKPPLEKTEKEMRSLLRSMVESDLAISSAHDSFSMPLNKAIIEDTEMAMKYCKILGIDFDKLMLKTITKGHSIFEIKWILEKVINKKYFRSLR